MRGDFPAIPRDQDRRPAVQAGKALLLPLSKAPMTSSGRRFGCSASVILHFCRPKPRKSVAVDEALPAQEFVDGQLIAVAGILKAEKAAAHSGDNLRFPADDPTLRIRWRKICDCQRTAIGSKNITQAGTEHFGHSTLTRDQDLRAL